MILIDPSPEFLLQEMRVWLQETYVLPFPKASLREDQRGM